MAGLDPAIHVFRSWMPGTRPGMTLSWRGYFRLSTGT